jgi:cell division septum initiation protein DivIVA
MLALAQKLHDEYVRAGQEEGDQILNDAKTKAATIVREAEDASVRTMSKLEQDRAILERKIDELRIFERDYRTRLKSYLENLLADIDGKAVTMSREQGAGWDGQRRDAQAGTPLGS